LNNAQKADAIEYEIGGLRTHEIKLCAILIWIQPVYVASSGSTNWNYTEKIIFHLIEIEGYKYYKGYAGIVIYGLDNKHWNFTYMDIVTKVKVQYLH
jgi:pyruvate/2-oxoacid:ferredoxin oxidoreductase beta subunit